MDRELDYAEKSRLERVVRRGDVGKDSREAAILVAIAQEAQRNLRLAVLLAMALGALNVVSALIVEDATVRFGNIAVIATAVVFIAVSLLLRRPLLLRAEHRNRALAGGEASD